MVKEALFDSEILAKLKTAWPLSGWPFNCIHWPQVRSIQEILFHSTACFLPLTNTTLSVFFVHSKQWFLYHNCQDTKKDALKISMVLKRIGDSHNLIDEFFFNIMLCFWHYMVISPTVRSVLTLFGILKCVILDLDSLTLSRYCTGKSKTP